jgi:CRISPR-associated protein Csx10
MSEVKFIVLTPKRAIHVGDVKAGNDFLGTLSYLPGSVLRGALAEWLIQSGRESDILPIVQRIRFGNLFLSESESVYSLPFPMTALECKVRGGFQQVPKEQRDKQGHGIRDSLLIALAYAELERLGACFPVPMALRCRKCKGRMERVSGFYARLPEGWSKVGVGQAMQTKVALSRCRRVAQEQILYRVIALRPQVVFVGRVWLAGDSDWGLLREAVENVGVGALTTRGFGTACLQESEACLPSVWERITQFNEQLREVWCDLAHLARQVKGNIPDEPVGTYFSVDLLAPAILHDEHCLPTLELTLQLNGEFLQPIFWATQPAFAGGWSTAWGLPKPTALAAAMGSVYVFRSEQSLSALLPHLEALEARGVGNCTDEGLGEILICHPFHLEVKST